MSKFSPWSDPLGVNATGVVNPTITSPLDGTTLTSTTISVTWSVSQQTKYQVRLLGDSSGVPNTGDVRFDSGEVADALARSTSFTANAAGVFHIELVTWNDLGQASNPQYVKITIDLPVATPVLGPWVNGQELLAREPLYLSWTFDDPVSTQSAWELTRQIDGGSVEWWNDIAESWAAIPVINSGAHTEVTIPDWGELGETHAYALTVHTDAGASSDPSSSLTVVAVEAPIIQLRRSKIAGRAPEVLDDGEVTLNLADLTLTTKAADGSIRPWVRATQSFPPFGKSGELAVATGNHRFYVEYPITVTSVRLSVGTPPEGADLICDINRNGSSIFAASDRPKVLATEFTSTTSVINSPHFNTGDYVSVDIDQVGSTVAGSDLLVNIYYLFASADASPEPAELQISGFVVTGDYNNSGTAVVGKSVEVRWAVAAPSGPVGNEVALVWDVFITDFYDDSYADLY